MGIYATRCLIVLGLLLLPFSPFASGQSALADRARDVIYFSVVPKKNFDQQIQELSPLLDLLERQLQKSIKVVRPQSYNAVIEGVLSRTLDFAALGPASYAKARARDNRVEAFAAFTGKKGCITPEGSYYYSVLFTLKRNGFKSARDLKQRKVAFTDPESTSGSVIPNMAFSTHVGEPLKAYFGTIVYTGSHDRSIKSVLCGHVDAAFVSSTRFDEAVEENILRPDQVEILWQSGPIHHDPFVFSSGVDNALKNRIREIVLSRAPCLETMLRDMNMAGLAAVSDKDYQAIHDIVSMQSRK